MSVGLMKLVFEADIQDLDYTKNGEARKAKASTVNCLLLAYADHANDEGEVAYPGYNRLERKTKLSRQGIADTLEACKQNGFLTLDGKSKLDTNSYTLNKTLLESLNTPITESSHLTQPSQATLLSRVKPLDLNHPLTKPQPSVKEDKNALKILQKLFFDNFGMETPLMTSLLRNASLTYPDAWFEPAFQIAVKNNVRNWAYVEAILVHWKEHGFGSKPEKTFVNGKTQRYSKTFNPQNGTADDNFMDELAEKRAKLKASLK